MKICTLPGKIGFLPSLLLFFASLFLVFIYPSRVQGWMKSRKRLAKTGKNPATLRKPRKDWQKINVFQKNVQTFHYFR